jgi:hypothetical protein
MTIDYVVVGLCFVLNKEKKGIIAGPYLSVRENVWPEFLLKGGCGIAAALLGLYTIWASHD